MTGPSRGIPIGHQAAPITLATAQIVAEIARIEPEIGWNTSARVRVGLLIVEFERREGVGAA